MHLADFSQFPRRRCSPRPPPANSKIPPSHHSWPDPARNEPPNLAVPSTRISNDQSASVRRRRRIGYLADRRSSAFLVLYPPFWAFSIGYLRVPRNPEKASDAAPDHFDHSGDFRECGFAEMDIGRDIDRTTRAEALYQRTLASLECVVEEESERHGHSIVLGKVESIRLGERNVSLF
jgi:hypothetical protein